MAWSHIQLGSSHLREARYTRPLCSSPRSPEGRRRWARGGWRDSGGGGLCSKPRVTSQASRTRKSPGCGGGTSEWLNFRKSTRLLAPFRSRVCTTWFWASFSPPTTGPRWGGENRRRATGQGRRGPSVVPAAAPGLSRGAGRRQMLIFQLTSPSPGRLRAPRSPSPQRWLSIPSCVTQQPVSSYREWIGEWRAGCVVTVFNIPPASHYIIQLLSKRIFSRLGFVIKIVINFFLFTKPEDLQMEASGARAASFWKWPF